MKAILLQNTIYKGERFVAGSTIDLPEAVALRFERAALAHIERTTETPQNGPEPVKADKRSAESKTPQKTSKRGRNEPL